MKQLSCQYLSCKCKIKELYKDMWKCKCNNYYCNEHKFKHECYMLKEKFAMNTIISMKVNKI